MAMLSRHAIMCNNSIQQDWPCTACIESGFLRRLIMRWSVAVPESCFNVAFVPWLLYMMWRWFVPVLQQSMCQQLTGNAMVKKGKVGRAPPERRRGAHLPFKAIEPVGGWTTESDAWPVRRQTYGYLPSCRAS